MSDPFNILGPEFDVPPSFDVAVREQVDRFQRAADRFQELLAQVVPDWFTEEEWRVIERSAEDLEQSVERAEEGYVAVQYDSHAWYRIMESLERVSLRLESAVSLIEQVQDRSANQATDAK